MSFTRMFSAGVAAAVGLIAAVGSSDAARLGGGGSLRIMTDAPRLSLERVRPMVAKERAIVSEQAREKIKRAVSIKPLRVKPDKVTGTSTGNGGNNGATRPGQTPDKPKPDKPGKPNDQASKPPRKPPIVIVRPPRPDTPTAETCKRGETMRRGRCRPNDNNQGPPDIVVVPPPTRPPVVVTVPPPRRPLPSALTAPPLAFVPVLPPSGGGQRPPQFVPPPPALPPLAAGPPPSLQALDTFVPDEILVTVASSAPQTLEDGVAQTFNVVILERTPLPLIDARLVRMRIPDSRTVPAVVAAIASDARVSLAQPNFVYRPSSDPAARVMPVAAMGTGIATNLQYALAAVNVAGAQRLAQGRGTRVAVIDSGVDRAHPDFASALIQEFDAFAEETKTAEDADRHGTGIAGIIAARGTVLGIAPDTSVLSARVFRAKAGQGSTATTLHVLKGMTWSAERGARVLNMSFAGPRDSLVERHVSAVVAKGVIPIAAAGNWGKGAAPAYPAAYPMVIAVTAIDAEGRLYDKANQGDYVAIAAPGVDVIVPGEGQSHEFQSGTSYAAAHVSGIVALMLEVNPDLTPAAARSLLEKASEDLGTPGRDDLFGFGRIDAERAVRFAAEIKKQ